MDSKRIAVARSLVYIIATSIAALLGTVSATGLIPEYTIAEARKHIGENTTLVGMVTCIGNGRRHTDLEMGGCLPATLLWVVVPNDVSGPELDCWKLLGVTIAVTGKIESSEGTPQITIKSTTQIVRRTSLDPNYLISANEKENKHDLDGAIADLDRAIDLTHEPGVYMQRARLKETKGDLAGAIRDYDQMIEQHAELDEAVRASYHDNRAKLKIRNRDFDGAIADATSAIQLNPRFPWHYATRGQANEAKGNFVAAVNDYKMAIKTEPHNSIYKDMLKHAQAQAVGSHGRNPQPGDSPQSATALVTQAKAKLVAGDFDGAIADCDHALQLSRGGSKEASGLRIQAMRAKGTSKAAVAQRVNPGRSQEEQPIAPTTKSGPAVAAGEARPKATSALLVDPTSGQPIGRETYNGSVKVEYSDGRSEIFCQDGNCTDPHVSHKGHVGWTHYTHRGNRNAAMNERLVIRFSDGQTKEFKPNPNGGPFIQEWNFIDNDVAVAIKSRGYHGAASFVRYDLISGRMTGHQDGYVEYEKMPEWAQPFSDDIPFGLHAPTTEPGPAASKPESAEVVDIPAQAEASQKHEQLLNKSQITPQSIAEAFVQAYSGTDVDALAGLYSDRVDHTNSGVISNAAVRAQAKEYFARWPVRHWSLVGTVNTVSLGTSKKKVIFSATYDASDPKTNKHASGIAKETLILTTDASGALKIVSQKEQTSKKGSSQSDEETSGDLDLKAAKAEASKKQPVVNPSQTNAPAQAQTGSPDCTSDPKSVWSEASPDKKLLATIRFVPDADQNCRACDDLKITVFRSGRDGKPGQILASTALLGCFLQCAHWSPDSQFLLFTTSLSRGAHGGWHFATFVYCAGDHSFRGDLEDVLGNVLAPDFRFESPDIAVLTVSDDQAPSTPGEEPPTKQVRVSLGKVVDKLDRLR